MIDRQHYLQYTQLIRAIVNERKASPLQDYTLKDSETGAIILQMDRQEQAHVAIAMLRWHQQNWAKGNSQGYIDNVASRNAAYTKEVLLLLLKRKLPFSATEIVAFLNAFQQNPQYWASGTAQMTNMVRNYLQHNSLTPKLQQCIEEICRRSNKISDWVAKDQYKYMLQLKQLLPSRQISLPILPGEAWTDQARQWITARTETEQLNWVQLLQKCVLALGSKPSLKWLKATYSERNQIGIEIYKQAVFEWFPLFGQPRTKVLSGWRSGEIVDVKNADVLKGLVWLCADQNDPELARLIGQLAVAAYSKVPGIGPRCAKVGTACIWTLGQISSAEATNQLILLKANVKLKAAQKGVDQSLSIQAQHQGVPPNEIEELSVPVYGLTEVGLLREQVGQFTAELVIKNTHNIVLRWIKPDGHLQKSVPKVIKTDCADQLKSLKQAAKDIKNMLPAQRDRMESFYLQQKTWDFMTWKEQYLDHRLVGTLTRRLLWQFISEHGGKEVGIWLAGRLVNLEGKPIKGLNNQTQVSLWHPLHASSETIQAWRRWLVSHQIQQPFRQAHRELYLLSPAEKITNHHSERFAGHILKQYPFHAFCRQKGWINQLQLVFDDDFKGATLPLPSWGLQAKFCMSGTDDCDRVETNDFGVAFYVSTDQLWFYSLKNKRSDFTVLLETILNDCESTPLPLSEIPALVLSEVMRDVNLLVEAASIGNDPSWPGGEQNSGHLNYWQTYAFGYLSEIAKTRRHVLEQLVPTLNIHDRCSFQNHFLLIKGDLHTYKIHIGSGNVFIEPNNQHLCITRGMLGKIKQVFLPFEEDNTLTFILRTLFFLASDSKITDETILDVIRNQGS